jgi:heme/copper-type cytochrome/quinol oxidase subunit 4
MVASVLVPATAWAASHDTLATTTLMDVAKRRGGIGFLGFLCCLIPLAIIIVAVVWIMRRRGRNNNKGGGF